MAPTKERKKLQPKLGDIHLSPDGIYRRCIARIECPFYGPIETEDGQRLNHVSLIGIAEAGGGRIMLDGHTTPSYVSPITAGVFTIGSNSRKRYYTADGEKLDVNAVKRWKRAVAAAIGYEAGAPAPKPKLKPLKSWKDLPKADEVETEEELTSLIKSLPEEERIKILATDVTLPQVGVDYYRRRWDDVTTFLSADFVRSGLKLSPGELKKIEAWSAPANQGDDYYTEVKIATWKALQTYAPDPERVAWMKAMHEKFRKNDAQREAA